MQLLVPELMETSYTLKCIDLRVVYQSKYLGLSVKRVLIDLHAWVGRSELFILREYKRVDGEVIAIPLNETFIGVHDEEGELRLTIRNIQVHTHLHQVFEREAFDVVDVDVVDGTRV